MSSFCYVCNKSASNLLINLIDLKSQFSAKSCIELITEILGDVIPSRQIQDKSNCICTICFNLIEDYDSHCLSVESSKNKLRQMLVKTDAIWNLTQKKTIKIKRPVQEITTNGIEIHTVKQPPEKVAKIIGPTVILNKPQPIDYVKHEIIVNQHSQNYQNLSRVEISEKSVGNVDDSNFQLKVDDFNVQLNVAPEIATRSESHSQSNCKRSFIRIPIGKVPDTGDSNGQLNAAPKKLTHLEPPHSQIQRNKMFVRISKESVAKVNNSIPQLKVDPKTAMRFEVSKTISKFEINLSN